MKNLLVANITNNLFNQIVQATQDEGGLYLLIDSYGGDLRAGYKIYDYLKGRKDVFCNVVGNCMSAAVLVLLGVNKENRTANEHAQFLIHRPLLEYNGQLTQKIAKQVDSAIEDETAALLKVYKKELNASDAALLSMLDAEQVFGARQAAAMGFISSVNEVNKDGQGETDKAALLDIAYNQKLINKKSKMEKMDLNACLDAIKNLFAGKAAMVNAKTIATADGKDIKVETDGDIKQGDKCDAENGSYVLGDNRTIVVKDGVIETIEEPEPEKKEETGPAPDAEKEELKEKVKNLESEIAKLNNEITEKNSELVNLSDVKAKMAEFEKVNNLITDAGGIDAILNAVSKAPNQKSDEAHKQDGPMNDAEQYDFIKNLG